MPGFWYDFPKVNRSYYINVNIGSLSAYLGCHSGTISGVSVSYGDGVYCSCPGHKSIKVLDTTKEKNLEYKQDRYGYTILEDTSERDRAFELIQGLDRKELLSKAYGSIIDMCTATPIWVMSDVINEKAPARKQPLSRSPLNVYPGHKVDILGNTGGFAKHLIENKIGYVLASPIVQNPNHRMKTNYSLNQVWIWVPPKHLGRCVNVAQQFGADKFPTKDDWVATVGKDLGIKEPAEVFKAAFETGVFPETNRFRRTRGRTKKKDDTIEVIQKILDENNPPAPKGADLVMVNQA